MRTKMILVLAFITIEFYSYPQEGNQAFLISKEVGKEGSTWTFYKDKNWDKFIQMPESYSVNNYSIDIEEIKKIAREEISPKYYDRLNKSFWIIMTRLTGDGQIVSLLFSFRNESIPDIHEFRNFSERIKKEVRWKLRFNKDITDQFNLEFSVQGPKL